jgi:hypothetical protein
MGAKRLVCPCNRADGFETGAIAGFWTIGEGFGNPFEIVSENPTPYHGNYCARATGDPYGWLWHDLTGTNTTKWLSFRYRIVPYPASPPTYPSDIPLVYFRLKGFYPGEPEEYNWDIQLRLITGGTPSPRFRIDYGFGVISEGTHVLEVNKWYCVRVRISVQETTVTTTVYLDGELDCTLTSDITRDLPIVYNSFGYLLLYPTGWGGIPPTCTTAIDNWCEVDGDSDPGCTIPDWCWE